MGFLHMLASRYPFAAVDIAIFGSGASLIANTSNSQTYGEFRVGYEQPVGTNGFLSLEAQAGVGEDSATQAASAFYKLTF